MLVKFDTIHRLIPCSSVSRTASTNTPVLVNSQRIPAAAPHLATPSEETSTGLQDVVNYCSSHLGLQGLACLAASSKQLKKACLQTATSDAALLLVHAVNAAAKEGCTSNAADSAACEKEQQHVRAAAWLLHVAPKAATAATTAEQLLRLPSVPLGVAKQFVKAGLRVSFAQLQAAANSMVSGVEVWMAAQQQLGVVTDVPTAVVEFCCGKAPPVEETRYWNKLWKRKSARAHTAEQLSKADVPGLLQLAMNSSSSNTALAAARQLDSLGLLDGAASSSAAGVVRRLLLTAAVRQHQSALLHMAGQPAILQLIDAATLQKVLEQLIRASDITSVNALLGKLQPISVQQLSSEAVVQLLRAAIAKDSCEAIDQLCQLPAAQQLSADAVAELLEAAWKHNCHKSAGHLFDALPAVQLLDAGTVARLAELTLQQLNGTYTTCLLTLPAAKELTTDMVTQLLEAAIKQSESVYVWRLYCTPGALQLSSSAVAKLLRAAVLQGSSALDHVANLSKLPAAARISTEQAQQLLQAAEDNLHTSCKMRVFQRLWHVPAAAEVMRMRLDALKERCKMWGLQANLQGLQLRCDGCFSTNDASQPVCADATAAVVVSPAATLHCGVV